MATCYQPITVKTCNEILSVCTNRRISRVWCGWARPVIFLEIGRLKKKVRSERREGQITFMIESDWRVEKPRSIHFGSGFSDRRIDNLLKSLVDVRLAEVEVGGRIPELKIKLADGREMSTFTNWDTQPRWSVGFNDLKLFPLDKLWKGFDVSPWVHVESGRLVTEYCYDHRIRGANSAVKKMGYKT